MKTLEQYREEFKQKKLMTMPLAGTIVWLILGCMALVLPQEQMVMPLYIGTGSIYYLALFLSKFTGEKLFVKSAEMNPFDKLFLYTMVMSLFCFSMAIPFGLQDFTSLPMTIGILAGLMWLPISWIIQHNVGIVHTTLRTVLIVTAWFAFPDDRFVTIPFIIVFVYLISLVQLYWRHKKVQALLVMPVANS